MISDPINFLINFFIVKKIMPGIKTSEGAHRPDKKKERKKKMWVSATIVEVDWILEDSLSKGSLWTRQRIQSVKWTGLKMPLLPHIATWEKGRALRAADNAQGGVPCFYVLPYFNYIGLRTPWSWRNDWTFQGQEEEERRLVGEAGRGPGVLIPSKKWPVSPVHVWRSC